MIIEAAHLLFYLVAAVALSFVLVFMYYWKKIAPVGVKNFTLDTETKIEHKIQKKVDKLQGKASIRQLKEEQKKS